MKTCPICNREYSDNTYSFCLDDGSILANSNLSESTQIIPNTRNNYPTEALPSDNLQPTITDTISPTTTLSPDVLSFGPAGRRDMVAIEIVNLSPVPLRECKVKLLSIRRWSGRQHSLLIDSQPIGPLVLPGPDVIEPEMPV